MFWFALDFSSRFKNGVYNLCSSGYGVIAGTAFIISKDQVLTAYHNIAADPFFPTKKLYSKNWVIAICLERLNSGKVIYCIENPIEVSYYRGSIKSDWALLKRTDGLNFPTHKILPICPAHLLPQFGDEMKLKLYQCPTRYFINGDMDGLAAIDVDLRLGIQINHKIVVVAGEAIGGSSGGIFVMNSTDPDKNGLVLAMHLESVSETKPYRFSNKEFIELSEDEILEESTDCHSSTHNSYYLYGIMISKLNQLVNSISK